MPRYEFAELWITTGKATLTNYNTNVTEDVFAPTTPHKLAYLSINGWRIVHVVETATGGTYWLQREIDWENGR